MDAGTGLLVKPRDPEALARAITDGLDRRGSVDRAALARAAEERYGYDAFAALWTDAYDRVL